MRRPLAAAFVCAVALAGLTSCATSASPTPPAPTSSSTTKAPAAPAPASAQRRPARHRHLLQPRASPDHGAGHAPRARPRRGLRPRGVVGLGQLQDRRLPHQHDRAGAGVQGLRRRESQLPAGPVGALARPDRRREVRHPLPARQCPPAQHRPQRDRRVGSERGRSSGRAVGHGRSRRRVGRGRVHRPVEQDRGRRRHGRAERPADTGQPGRQRRRRPRASCRCSARSPKSDSEPTCGRPAR